MPMVTAAVLEAPERLVLREFERPRLGPDDGLLEVELAGICGTDWKSYHGKLDDPLPLILGHEILGRIAEGGERFMQRYQLHPGDRVMVESAIPCWACIDCQTGNYRFCTSKQGYGTTATSTKPPHLWGAFAHYMYLAPGSVIHRIDNSLPAEAAVVAGVIANGIQWARTRGGVRPRDVVVVQGCGPQGLAATLAAHDAGAREIITTGLARDAERLELARVFGATHTVDAERESVPDLVRELTDGRMADVVVDVSGSPRAIPVSTELVRKRGTLVLGGLTGRDVQTSLKIDTLVWNEVKVQGVFTKGVEAVQEAIKLVESRAYPVERMVTHKFPLQHAADAIKAIGGETPGLYPIKAVVVPE